MRHRETEFDVEEGPPSWWHWIIYPGGALPEIIGETMFHRRRPLLLPALKKSIMGLREAETRRKSVQPVNEGPSGAIALGTKTAPAWRALWLAEDIDVPPSAVKAVCFCQCPFLGGTADDICSCWVFLSLTRGPEGTRSQPPLGFQG